MFLMKFSSLNLFSQIDFPPVPLPFVKSPPWTINPGIIRWKLDYLYPNPFSPVQSFLKFQAVLGVTSSYNFNTILPIGVSSMAISMYTSEFSGTPALINNNNNQNIAFTNQLLTIPFQQEYWFLYYFQLTHIQIPFIIFPSHKNKHNKMSYSRQQIQNIIARNKKRNNTQKSPSPPLSPKSIAANRSNSPKDMTVRYQELCSKYKALLEDVKDKNHKFQLQEVELERLKLEKERDQKQLYRLRSIIGFIKKQDKGMQVNMDMQSAGSWSTKIQKSTALEYQNDLDWHTPVKQTQSFKLNRKKSPTSKQFPTSTTLIAAKTGYKTHTQDMYDNFDSDQSKMNTETIYSPKNSNKELNTIFKTRESRDIDAKYSKLSNSPYSKLRFSRNM